MRPVNESALNNPPLLGAEILHECRTPWLGTYDLYQRGQYDPIFANMRASLRSELTVDKVLTIGRQALRAEPSRAAFNDIINSEAQRQGTFDELAESARAPMSSKYRLTKLLLDIKGSEAQPSLDYDFASSFLRRDTKQSVRHQMIDLHSDYIRRADRLLQQSYPNLFYEFIGRLSRAINEGHVAENSMPDGQRLDSLRSLRLLASDPVIDRLNMREALYEPKAQLIRVSAEAVNNPRHLPAAVFHELLHASAGHLVLGDKDVHEFAVTRLSMHKSCHQLNEAYTEYAAMVLQENGYDHEQLWHDYLSSRSQPERFSLDNKYGGYYLNERIMLAGLIANGLDEDLFSAAYFESYLPKQDDPERPAGQTMPYTRALDQSVASRFGSRSLPRLWREIKAPLDRHYSSNSRPFADARQKSIYNQRLLGYLERFLAERDCSN